MDTGLDKDKTVLGILVLAIALEMLADGDCLLNQLVEVLGNLRSKS